MFSILPPFFRMKSPMKNILAAGAVSLLLVACNSGPENAMERAIENEAGGDADVEMNADGTMHIETDEGTYNTGNEIPADWPEDVPTYADAIVQYSASVDPVSGKPGSILVMMSTDSIEDVTEFYKNELAAQGWNLEGSMQGGGMTIMGGMKDERQVSVMIAGADGQTSITLAVGEKE